jgi:hypothetical protein
VTQKAVKEPVEMNFGPNPHYLFVHQVLRQEAQDDPLQFFIIMASEQRAEYIQYLLDLIDEYLEEEKTPFGAEAISVELMSVNHCPMVLLIMPEPQFSTHAYMVGIVLDDQNEEAARVEYYTLELGRDAKTGQAITFLCGWQGDTHLNYGSGFEPTAEAFIREIKKRIESDQESRRVTPDPGWEP